MPPLGMSFHLLIEDEGVVLSAILIPFDSNQFILFTWAISLFQKLFPVPFPPDTKVAILFTYKASMDFWFKMVV